MAIQKQIAQTEEKQQPIFKARAGKMQIAIFANTSKDGNAFDSITLQKSYTLDNGKTWEKQKINLMTSEVIDAILVLQAALQEERVVIEE